VKAYQPSEVYHRRLRASVKGMIRFAERRQLANVRQGKERVAVTISEEEAIEKLRLQGYQCALTHLPFWTDEGQRSFGPMSPSFDRIKHAGPYSRANIRIILSGVNALRGSGSDRDMYRIAAALVNKARRIV
jgi:hypothetical protein